MNEAKIIDDYYEVLNVPMELVSRRHEHLQPRVALMVAMSRYRTDTRLGDLFGLDRSSVNHHRNNHKNNTETWGGYKNHYDLACSIINQNLKRRI
jgi:hypothetical protein